MPGKVSAGLLLFRYREGHIELLVAHPGGPFFRNKHEGAWTIPKGQVDEGEDLLDAAKREFNEETSFNPHSDHYISLGAVRQRSGKLVHAWAFEGDCEPATLESNRFEMEWPRHSGKMMDFPEVDRVVFARPDEARRLLNKAQTVFVSRLLAALQHA